MKHSPPKLAVFIDGDNVSPQNMDGLFEAVGTLGDAVIRRVFGSQFGSKGWMNAAARHGLSGGRRHPHVSGRNASDIELVIDAMDVLSSATVDAFCLVSSDADFTPLAVRLREAGKVVYVFGDKAPESFRKSCHQWFPISLAKAPVSSGNVTPFPQPAVTKAVAALKATIDKCGGANGWAPMSAVGLELKRQMPSFSVRDHGASTLKKFALNAGCFEVKTEQGRPVIRIGPGH